MALLLNSLTQHTQDLKDAARGVTGALVQLVQDNQQEDGLVVSEMGIEVVVPSCV